MEYLVIALVAFGASLLTFFSGFGLGTLLMPVVSFFFPIEVAIAVTGVVHFANNVFKMLLVRKHVQWRIGWQFGITAFFAAILGAWLLLTLQQIAPLYQYQLGTRSFMVTPVKLVIGLLLLFFAIAESRGVLGQRPWQGWRSILAGGLVSGFFGGLSGHQGALRSAFLVKAGLGKQAFIATGVMIALFVDIGRIPVYQQGLKEVTGSLDKTLIFTAIIAAAIGAIAGNRLLTKVSLTLVQQIVFVMLIVMALLLMAGLV